MTTLAFNLWAARFQRRLDERMADVRAAAVLNDQRTACATTCRIELLTLNEGATI